MASRISEIIVGCHDPAVLARFWCEVLDFVEVSREDDGSIEVARARVSAAPSPRGQRVLPAQEATEGVVVRLH
jgi:hypothetical protein